LELQNTLEKQAFILGGENYNAPAQLVGDFIAAKPSAAVGSVEPSYKPGVTWSDLSRCLPEYAITAIREALPAFDKKIRGFAMYDAVLTGVETISHNMPFRRCCSNDSTTRAHTKTID
jgi:uncharacterized FAD-dependent dehydrogenase